jgi:hypothetical protein
MALNKSLVEEFKNRFGFNLPLNANLFFLEGYCRVVGAVDLADKIAVALEQKIADEVFNDDAIYNKWLKQQPTTKQTTE